MMQMKLVELNQALQELKLSTAFAVWKPALLDPLSCLAGYPVF